MEAKEQFNLSYSGDSRFASMLEDPSFSIILEVPAADNSSSVKELLKAAAENASVFAVALPDGCDMAPDKKQLDFAEAAIAITAKPVISYISGRGKSKDDVLAIINKLREMGLRDFVAVTGDYHKGSGSYLDSIDGLKLMADGDDCAGAVVNPFKYLHEDQFFQYAKLIGKIKAGARFLVSQAGWDMKKYQELIWYLRSRELLVPVIARIAVIDTADEGILSTQLHPGVAVPLHIAAAAQRSAADAAEFIQVQAHTAAFVAAGCRLMGYNGIQLSGVHTAAELEAFLANLSSILEQYPTFEAWATAWNTEFNETALMPAVPNLGNLPPFYLYESLMQPEIQAYSAKTAKASRRNIGKPTLHDMARYLFLAGEHTPAWVRSAAKYIIRCKSDDLQLRATLGVKPDLCPKGLCNAPCGNSTADGLCECGAENCVFQRILRLALQFGQISKLEGDESR